MKIIHFGATGTLGKYVCEELGSRHEIVRVGRKSGDLNADLTSIVEIRSIYERVGSFDAVICTAGGGYFGPFDAMRDREFRQGVESKMMGQINLVLEGHQRIKHGGSFTLTTGILSEDPVPMASNLSAINGAVNAFVRAASIELPRGIRINAVSPGLVEDSMESLGSYFPGHMPVKMEKMVSGYVKSVEGKVTGQVIRLY